MKSKNLNDMLFEWFTKSSLVLILITVCNGQKSSESSQTSMYYMCPPEFIRLGSSCYYFSKEPAVWQDAHFACKDRESNLSAPQRWEDKHLREYLNKPDIEKHERWIGGMYDWGDKTWKWGGQMREMKYQSFARMKHLPPEQLQWHCIAMDPNIEYRWSPVTCMKKNYYICQSKLHKVYKPERNRLRQKWNLNGNGQMPNEIRAPDLNEVGNTQDNEVRPSLHDPNATQRKYNKKNPYVNNNPKSYIKKHKDVNNTAAALTRPHKKKPFKGYRLDDTEAAYLHNIRALKSGKTGLSNVEIERHLKRLERMRRKEMSNLKKKERLRDRLNIERSIRNNIYNPDILSDRTNNLKNRNLGDERRERKNRGRSRDRNRKKSSHSIENVTQKTYLMDNQLSALHPKTIVEIHDFSNE